MRKSSPTHIGPKILLWAFLLYTFKAAAIVHHKDPTGRISIVLRCPLLKSCMNSLRIIRTTQLPIKTIVTPVGKSDPKLDLQTDIIANINNFIDHIESVVIGHKLGCNTIFCFHLLPESS